MVAVGFNPRAARPQNNPRRSATHESVSGAMTPTLFNRRSATEWIFGVRRGPWVETNGLEFGYSRIMRLLQTVSYRGWARI